MADGVGFVVGPIARVGIAAAVGATVGVNVTAGITDAVIVAVYGDVG
jgi:hypothetical protein